MRGCVYHVARVRGNWSESPNHHCSTSLAMKPLLIACLIVAATTAAGAQTRTALRVIREDVALLLTEGGSYYRFNLDSSFRSGPVGLSGRTITGRWRGGDDVFIVEGRWGWVNGQSSTEGGSAEPALPRLLTNTDARSIAKPLPSS